MFKKTFVLHLITFLTLLWAAEWQIRSTTTVGPGIVHKHYVDADIPWNMNVLIVDLTNPYLTVETVKANDALAGNETTSSMAARNSSPGHRVAGAINADFYEKGGIPVGAQIIKGELLKGPYHYSALGFDINSLPTIGVLEFSGSVRAQDQSIAISGVNKIRDTDQLILYNGYYGSTTATNQWGKELLIAPLNGWLVNDTLKYVVEKIEDYVGSMAIPAGKAVLSAHGASIPFFNTNVHTGDTLRLVLSLQPALKRLKELVGGFPRIVKDGRNYALEGYKEEGGSSSFATDFHPRTAAGFNADSSKLYLFVIDGRQTGLSRGMSLPELADFMIEQGVSQGINLDGGGSSTMVVAGTIKNSPSDGHERAVANALLIVSSAPQSELNEVQIEPDFYTFFRGDNIRFTTSGWDSLYNPVPLDENNLKYSVDSTLGTVDEQGNFTAAANGGDGFVYARYGLLKDSAQIHIKGLRNIEIQPENCLTDTLQTIEFSVKALDENYEPITLSAENYKWSVSDSSIATIDERGRFKAVKEGIVKVFVQYAELKDTADVRVEVKKGRSVLDSVETLWNWRLSGVNIDTLLSSISLSDSTFTLGSQSLRIDYHFTRLSSEYSYVHLDTDIPVPGVPEYIELDFRSDGQQHKCYVVVSDDNGEYFKSSTKGYADLDAQWDTLSALTRSFRPLDDGDFFYPIRLKSIWIRLGASSAYGEENEGTVFLDNLRIRYPQVTALYPLQRNKIPSQSRLFPNYPNPFNPQTTIRFYIAARELVRVDIFDILGRRVKTLLNRELNRGRYEVRWNAAGQASGVYICRLQTPEKTQLQKMLLLR